MKKDNPKTFKNPPECINGCGEMEIEKHLKLKDRKKYKPKAKSTVTRFICPICDYVETVWAHGSKDFAEQLHVLDDVQDMYKQEEENRK